MWYGYKMNITILCRVIDNLGDIGVVFRLSRALLEQNIPFSSMRLIVSGLEAFSKIEPCIQANLPIQTYRNCTVFDWDAAQEGTKSFTENPPHILLECFACGRPVWLDTILFDNTNERTVRIVNIEYLTAEPWADEFHLLKSGTRKKNVKKVNFMPGFTPQTGGLILDNSFIESRTAKANAIQKVCTFLTSCGAPNARPIEAALKNPDTFCTVVFSYKTHFLLECAALTRFKEKMCAQKSNFSLCPLVAAGTVFEEQALSPVRLPQLPQEIWDALLLSADFLFIRGEDSFSRAALSGIPFLWQAYPQEDNFHLVKVNAFLERLKPFFYADPCHEANAFQKLRQCSLLYNYTPDVPLCPEARDVWEDVFPDGCVPNKENLLVDILCNAKDTQKAFDAFSRSLLQNGNLATHLLDFLRRTTTNDNE